LRSLALFPQPTGHNLFRAICAADANFFVTILKICFRETLNENARPGKFFQRVVVRRNASAMFSNAIFDPHARSVFQSALAAENAISPLKNRVCRCSCAMMCEQEFITNSREQRSLDRCLNRGNVREDERRERSFPNHGRRKIFFVAADFCAKGARKVRGAGISPGSVFPQTDAEKTGFDRDCVGFAADRGSLIPTRFSGLNLRQSARICG
jgi:hypothetical protein